ncbi:MULTISPECIES: exodeoxyribonuclease VII small subunit [Oceanobacillus]|uniref:Exodeoxyribonuclease 7 small subunit n=1 Tax=Oceanobacillus kimchii TaxID=746691 RepID=A0ABQ5TK80_9BACI|nr:MULTISPECIES: exodeoxyribonuclease VII small subunit [Oceanobacillus]MBT2598370.1 exodeoxyribonuclease VII small subunit [Oceanobacillus sp. ISL-74]MBT2651288.1 exodeoxyribonuclease VII small subunit [Oceanobacillus sp. ISL-73]MCT1575947.1 exodeoxyribonuclease VII small subunit [Oceanobacillus kimchii]MCT2135584.1 exodeoxyribonuclease VII small subunit [Oceanobacillus kimchii]OEH55685.1 exodeoxyribonuclease VII small subunit [Oceanobacillus sp. E9]
MATKDLTFEQAIEKLEGIVSKLEEGDVPLEKAIEYYQEGMNLSKLCSEKLNHVQDKMVQIMNEQGELEPFDIQEDPSS